MKRMCECGIGGKPCEIEYGFCHCRCGRKTEIAKQTDKRNGWVKGEPRRFIRGHYVRRIRPPEERFWSHVNKNGPMPSPEAVAVWQEIAGQCCWIYGKDAEKRIPVWVAGAQVPPHRAAWYLETGRWPTPLCLHKCDRTACVRFSHLFEGTHEVNTKDMLDKKRDRMIGERSSFAKLTWERVRRIRRDCAPWVRHPRRRGTILLVKRLARRFGVTVFTIYRILKNEIWRETR